MIENSLLLAAIQDRDCYEQMNKYVEETDFNPVAKLVYKTITECYKRDSLATKLDLDMVIRLTKSKIKTPKQQEQIQLIFDIGVESISKANVLFDLLTQKRSSFGNLIIQALGDNNHKKARELIDKYIDLDDGLTDKTDSGLELTTGFSLDRLEKALVPDLEIVPRALSERIDGGVKRHHHIGIIGRPNMCKSLVALNMACGWMRRGYKGMYYQNEEGTESYMLRIISNLSNGNKLEILEDPDHYIQIAEEKGLNNLTMASVPNGCVGELNELLQDHKSDFVIADQIYNFAEPKTDGMTPKLQKAAAGMRAIAKRHDCVSVSITQAGESADGKKVIEPEDTEYCNTGFHAALDLFLGMGATPSDVSGDMRCWNIGKNKINGKHEWFMTKVDITKSKVISL